MKYLAIFSTILLLAGCEQAYRYPCQNPENWDKPECQKPICEVNRDCPEYIFDNPKKIGNTSSPMNTKGNCK